MTSNWREVWSDREISARVENEETIDAFLLRADGYDTPFGAVDPDVWRVWVNRILKRFGLKSDQSILEIGCGAGAFLIEPWRRGHKVGGIDLSPRLIAIARDVMPGGQFLVADAERLPPMGPWDAVIACGVMMYLPSTVAAATVFSAMASSARSCIALLDLPDLALKNKAESFRRGHLTEQAYRNRYAGLDHLYFDRDCIRKTLVELGFPSVVIEDQSIEGYANSTFRFNAFASRLKNTF